MNVLWIAAENAALAGGKIGGIGDVVRDLPRALARRGCRVTALTPSHGFLHRQNDSKLAREVRFRFRGLPHTAEIHEAGSEDPGVRQMILHHPWLDASGRIYAHDAPDAPFFTDANRFSLFSVAAAAAVLQALPSSFDAIHLHDWHAAGYCLLRAFDPEYAKLKKTPVVFSIHNLAYQGIRPLRGSDSSLEAWFHGMAYAHAAVADPRWPDCVNLMAAGIRLADRVHTVSPSYAEEIQQPSRKPAFYGGEGLEGDLLQASRQGRLSGILNGCDYPEHSASKRLTLVDLLARIRSETIRLSAGSETAPAAHFIAHARTMELERTGRPDLLLTAVSRLVEQKALLLREKGSEGRSGLESILRMIGKDGCFILLGAGDPEYEGFFREAAGRWNNFLFVNGYSDGCAEALYASGDLFVMPSSFEPCGLSQLLAMREGQPCVVHEIGGLRDTVKDGETGFAFGGESLPAQVDGMVAAVARALSMKRGHPQQWKKIREKAAAARFTWDATARAYMEELYKATAPPTR